MTFASSGTAALVSSVTNTTATQATNAVLAPSYYLTGTPQVYPSGASASYALLQGSAGNAGSQLLNPPTNPLQNQWASANAQAPASGVSTVNGLPPYGIAQTVKQNPCGRASDIVPVAFDLIINQLITMSNLTYRI